MNTLPLSRTAQDSVRDQSCLLQTFSLHPLSGILDEMLKAAKASLDSIKQELSLLEDARLYLHKSSRGYHFGCIPTGTQKEIGISQDSARIHSLARRAFLQRQATLEEQTVSALQLLFDMYCPEEDHEKSILKFRRFHESGLNLFHVLFTEKQNEWIRQPYTPNPYYPEKLKYPTAGGIWMRSKSEAKFGSMLEEAGIPYRYDDRLVIHSDYAQDRPDHDSYFADFKIPNLRGGITIHEHFGAFQLDQYSENALKRLNDYLDFEVYELPGRPVRHTEFTWSFEGDLYDSARLSSLMRRILLPF